MEGTKLIYLMDPHCGWCFGFSKTINEFYELLATDGSVEFGVVPGGLFIPRIGGSSAFADDKRPIASRIEDTFGVEISPNYFENVLAVQWIDSTPASQAILACNAIEPSKTMHLSTAILQAAFVEGRNISLLGVVLEVAQEQGFDPDGFSETMTSPNIEDNLNTSLRFAAQVRTGFPAVFVQNTERDTLVHLGGADLSVSELQAAIDTQT